MSLDGPTYNQLTVFHAIAEQGSITGAARKLQITPASVSQALKLLEDKMGLSLFSRTTRSVNLTDAGIALRESTSRAMTELDFALEAIEDLTRTPKGKLSITAPAFVFKRYLQPVYADFCQQYPEIELEISISDALVDILSEGIDLGIRFGDKVQDGMVARQLTPPLTEAVFAAPAYLDKYGTPKSIQCLASHKMVRYRFTSSNQLAPFLLEHEGKEVSVEMPAALVSNDTEAMIDAVLMGLGIGKMAIPAVEHHLKSGALVPVLPENWKTYPGLYLYFLQNSQKARRVRVFIDFIIEKFRQ